MTIIARLDGQLYTVWRQVGTICRNFYWKVVSPAHHELQLKSTNQNKIKGVAPEWRVDETVHLCKVLFTFIALCIICAWQPFTHCQVVSSPGKWCYLTTALLWMERRWAGVEGWSIAVTKNPWRAFQAACILNHWNPNHNTGTKVQCTRSLDQDTHHFRQWKKKKIWFVITYWIIFICNCL